MKIVLPVQALPKERLAHASQGVVYALDNDIVLKIPFQYEVTSDLEQAHHWDLSLRSFVTRENESTVYNALQQSPHPNFPRSFITDQSDYLFLERLEPLQDAWPNATYTRRCNWALDLLSALSWLEKRGFVHGDLAVRNLGVDVRSQSLKLFDFGSAISCLHLDFSNDINRDHFDLATCLHFILAGVDPFAHVGSRQEATMTRHILETGQWKIAKDAEVIGGIIKDGWAGRHGSIKFSDLFDRVANALRITRQHSRPTSPTMPAEDYYQELQSRCQDWLRNAQRNPLWKDADEYVAACRSVGHRAVLDDWR